MAKTIASGVRMTNAWCKLEGLEPKDTLGRACSASLNRRMRTRMYGGVGRMPGKGILTRFICQCPVASHVFSQGFARRHHCTVIHVVAVRSNANIQLLESVGGHPLVCLAEILQDRQSRREPELGCMCLLPVRLFHGMTVDMTRAA